VAAVTVPTHIGLSGRKALLARLLAFEAREQNAPNSDGDAPDRVVSEMIDSGNRAIANGILSEPLDDWLRDSVKRVRAITEASWGSQVGTPADVMLQALARRAGGLSCKVCSGDRVCRGNSRDHSVVASGGHCIKHIADVFSNATTIAEAYYRRYARGFVGPPKLALFTSEVAAKPHDIPIPIYLGGETRYEDDKGGPVSAVELRVAIRLLDWQSWLAVLYLFLHELVCHAYAGTAPPHRGRRELRSFDPFAEGWMDRICGMILEDVANAVPPVPKAIHIPFRAEHIDAGNQFRLQRQSPRRDNGGTAWSVVQSVRASKHMFRAIQALVQEPAREAMYRVSLDLNLLERPVMARSQIICVVERGLAGPHTELYGMMIRSLNQYLNGGARHNCSRNFPTRKELFFS
jgi:hypothetical protein